MNIEHLVSICIPCYNHEFYLKDCLDSIMAQDYRNMELIIIDDCSTDNSVSIINSIIPDLEKRFQRVIFKVNSINMGVVKTSNQCFKLARGYYIKDFSSDDMMFPNCISKLVKYMDEHKDYLLCIANGVSVGNDCNYNNILPNENHLMDISKISSIDNLFDVLLYGNIITCVGSIYKKEIFEKYGYYDESIIYEDWDFWLTISRLDKINFLDEDVIYYRKSITSFGAYKECTGEEARKKFLRMYLGGKQTLLKHTQYVDAKIKNMVLSYYFRTKIVSAIEVGYNDIKDLIYSDIKNAKVRLTLKDLFACLFAKNYKQLSKIYSRLKK